MFCPNCGEEITQAAHCRWCGQRIKVGDEDPVAFLNQPILGPGAESALNTFKGMLTSPVSTIQELVKNPSFASSSILTTVVCLLHGLLVMGFVHSIAGSLSRSIGNQFFGFFGYLSRSIPYGSIFWHVLILSLFSIVGLAAGIYIFQSVFGGNGSVSKGFSVSAAVAVQYSAGMLIGFILSNIWVPLGLAGILAGGAASAICVFYGIREMSVSEDRGIYATSLAFFVLFIIQSIVFGFFF